LPDVGILQLLDPETGDVLWIDTSLKQVREQYRQLSQAFMETRNKIFKRNRIEFVDLFTHQPYDVPLVKFFRERAKRFR
jgi:hypothetical protein